MRKVPQTTGSVEEFDVVVLGSGASALASGMVWIRCNHHMEAAGAPDSRDDALRYLDSLSHDRIVPELAGAYVDTGPEMLRWFEDNTPVVFEIVENFPDDHPEHPGGWVTGGRSLECPLFAFGELGEWQDRVSQSRQTCGVVVRRWSGAC